MLWFFWEFCLYETDGDVKKHILTEEIPKSYNFKILSCKEYRGFEFLGISSRGNTIRVHLSPFWDLCQKYSVGDKIEKLKGTKEILLIKQNETCEFVCIINVRSFSLLHNFVSFTQKINPIVVFSRENQLSLWAKWQ